jgi:hypothetical protein
MEQAAGAGCIGYLVLVVYKSFNALHSHSAAAVCVDDDDVIAE